jgi:hypothetical protein
LAPNKPIPDRCPCQGCAFSQRAAQAVAIATSFLAALLKIQAIYNGKKRANYNARPCADERKAAGARTMGINEKTMRRTMEAMGNTEL